MTFNSWFSEVTGSSAYADDDDRGYGNHLSHTPKILL